MAQLALGRHAADAEIRYAQLDLAVRPRLHQDVRRLQVPVDDGRREPVRVPHATDDVPHDARDHPHRQLALVPLQLPMDEGGQVAAADILVLQAGHFRVQRRVQQRHDAGVAALPHDLAQHGRLVPQRLRGFLVQAELQRDALGHVRVPGLPDLAEASHAEKFLQSPITEPRHWIADLETRQSSREESKKVGRLCQPQLGGHGAAARVVGPALGCLDGVGHLAEVGSHSLAVGFR